MKVPVGRRDCPFCGNKKSVSVEQDTTVDFRVRQHWECGACGAHATIYPERAMDAKLPGHKAPG